MPPATGTWTRGNKADCFEHIFRNVFKLEDKDNLSIVFGPSGQDVHATARYTFDELSKLEYETDDGSGGKMMVKLPLQDFRILQCFNVWEGYCHES